MRKKEVIRDKEIDREIERWREKERERERTKSLLLIMRNKIVRGHDK